MSAWDISGAVVWTVLAFFSSAVVWAGWQDRWGHEPQLVFVFGCFLTFTALAIFCIAGLFGAHP